MISYKPDWRERLAKAALKAIASFVAELIDSDRGKELPDYHQHHIAKQIREGTSHKVKVVDPAGNQTEVEQPCLGIEECPICRAGLQHEKSSRE